MNFLPGLGKDNSMTSKEGAFLLSLLGLGDTIGRLPVGILFDLPVIKVLIQYGRVFILFRNIYISDL